MNSSKEDNMKEWSNEHVFNFPWDQMVEAAYRKYPNPHSPSVHSLDTLSRRVTPVPGGRLGTRLFSHRIFSTRWSVPAIVLKVIGTDPEVTVNEQSLCDLDRKTLTIRARNMTLSSLFTMDETLEYSVCPEDSTKTVLKQTAKIDVSGIPLIGGLMESMWIGHYESTVENGRKGICSVAEKITEEIRDSNRTQTN